MTHAQATKFVTALDGLLRSRMHGDGGTSYADKCRREMIEALTTPSDPTHEPAPAGAATAHGYIFVAAAHAQKAGNALDSALQLHGGPYVVEIDGYERMTDKIAEHLKELGQRVDDWRRAH